MKIDILTRKLDDKLQNNDDRLLYQHRTLLTFDKLKIYIFKSNSKVFIYDRILIVNKNNAKCTAIR